MVARALDVYRMLSEKAIFATVVNCSTVKPVDEKYLSAISSSSMVFTMEEHMITGGFGEYVTRVCKDKGYVIPSICFGVDDTYIQHGSHELLMKDVNLDTKAITDRIVHLVKGEKQVV
jgi:1-deoxy-D-xylulose-5-phosphate synthase